jgi:hypothetical protein
MFTAPPTRPSVVATVSRRVSIPTRIGRSGVEASPVPETIARPASTAADALGKTT